MDNLSDLNENKALLQKAHEVLSNSYSPYSNFKVAAAILTQSGKIFTGVNIENLSYPAGICAERCAMSKAISEGEKIFKKIAVVSSANTFTYPCGICRQFMSEFMNNDSEIILSDNDIIKVFKFSEIMPYAFDSDF